MPKGRTVFTDAVVTRMHEMSRQCMESRDAHATLIKEGLLPENSRLTTFRTRCTDFGIKWGGKVSGRFVNFQMPQGKYEQLLTKATELDVPASVLVRRLIRTIVRENLFAAVLDDPEIDL